MIDSRRRLIAVEDLLDAIVDLADDGFCERHELGLRFRGFGARQLQRSIARAARQGLLLERRGPDGRAYLALSAAGWGLIRSRTTGSGI